MIIGIGIGIAILGGAYVAGLLLGASGNPSTIKPGENIAVLTCPAASKQWLLRRAERCNAERDQANAQARVENDRVHMVAMFAAAAAMAAVAASLLPIPIVGQAAAIAALAIAAALLVYAVYLLGVLGAAETDLANKTRAAQDLRTAEARALEIMLQSCPEDEIARSLALPSPC